MQQKKVEIRWAEKTATLQDDGKTLYPKLEKVAAYCRVSTELDEQENSFELQKAFYRKLIRNMPDWDFAGIYADRGITGTQCKIRPGFQRMIRRCKEGKIDRILCKSISRFARNTLDTIGTVRELKAMNIRVVFEKEGIDTLSGQSEFILSTIAAIAQDESRNISENMLWSFQKKFESGVPVFQKILGYDVEKTDQGPKVIINETEAETVQIIYSLRLSGKGYTEIARMMAEEGRLTVKGNTQWTRDMIKSILTNERYTGNVLCQKFYTLDYLSHQCKRNHGERPQYFIENHHAGIITEDIFQAVQKTPK